MRGKKTERSSKKKTKLKTLSDWDWTVTVAAWRYYEYRMTIASSMFPGDIVKRFFSGDYDNESCDRIARQFVEIDHHNGEKDWTTEGLFNKGLHDCDKESWCMFWAFLKAYIHGFTTVEAEGTVMGQKFHEEFKCFYCEYTKHWHPVKQYIKNPNLNQYVPDDCVKTIDGGLK